MGLCKELTPVGRQVRTKVPVGQSAISHDDITARRRDQLIMRNRSRQRARQADDYLHDSFMAYYRFQVEKIYEGCIARKNSARANHASDIVVVDSYSSDKTVAIAQGYQQVRLFQRSFDTHAFIVVAIEIASCGHFSPRMPGWWRAFSSSDKRRDASEMISRLRMMA
jgi:hypothetical protein